MEAFGSITLGNILTIITIIIGFVHNYVYIVQRITKLEIESKRNKEDIDKLYHFLKNNITLKSEQGRHGRD